MLPNLWSFKEMIYLPLFGLNDTSRNMRPYRGQKYVKRVCEKQTSACGLWPSSFFQLGNLGDVGPGLLCSRNRQRRGCAPGLGRATWLLLAWLCSMRSCLRTHKALNTKFALLSHKLKATCSASLFSFLNLNPRFLVSSGRFFFRRSKGWSNLINCGQCCPTFFFQGHSGVSKWALSNYE